MGEEQAGRGTGGTHRKTPAPQDDLRPRGRVQGKSRGASDLIRTDVLWRQKLTQPGNDGSF